MDYELARQLEEAGWFENWRHDHCGYKWIDKDGDIFDHPQDDACMIPALSELIEACGDKFGALMKRGSWWYAITRKDLDNRFGIGLIGKTPEETVARLWLELQK